MGNDTCSAHLVAKIMKKHSFIDSQLPLEKLPKNLGLCPSRVTESLSDAEQSPSLETQQKGKYRAWTFAQTVSWLCDLRELS